MAYISAHWINIAAFLGVWAAIATALNRTWPKPTGPAWKVALHIIFIDLPAFLPTVNMKGMFGLPINIPYITLSGGGPPLAMLFLIGLSGCAVIKPILVDIGRCELRVMPKEALLLVEDIVGIFMTNDGLVAPMDWKDQMGRLAVKYGMDAGSASFKCVIDAIIKDFGMPAGSSTTGIARVKLQNPMAADLALRSLRQWRAENQ